VRDHPPGPLAWFYPPEGTTRLVPSHSPHPPFSPLVLPPTPLPCPPAQYPAHGACWAGTHVTLPARSPPPPLPRTSRGNHHSHHPTTAEPPPFPSSTLPPLPWLLLHASPCALGANPSRAVANQITPHRLSVPPHPLGAPGTAGTPPGLHRTPVPRHGYMCVTVLIPVQVMRGTLSGPEGRRGPEGPSILGWPKRMSLGDHCWKT